MAANYCILYVSYFYFLMKQFEIILDLTSYIIICDDINFLFLELSIIKTSFNFDTLGYCDYNYILTIYFRNIFFPRNDFSNFFLHMSAILKVSNIGLFKI